MAYVSGQDMRGDRRRIYVLLNDSPLAQAQSQS